MFGKGAHRKKTKFYFIVINKSFRLAAENDGKKTHFDVTWSIKRYIKLENEHAGFADLIYIRIPGKLQFLVLMCFVMIKYWQDW